MDIQFIELTMAQISELLMTPVIIICALLAYSIYALSQLISQWLNRRQNKGSYVKQTSQGRGAIISGYPTPNYFVNHPDAVKVN